MSNSAAPLIPTVAPICAADTKFRSKPIPSRNRPVTIWAAYTVFWPLHRNFPASRENQSFDITLIGRWITVVQNGQTIIDNKEISGITGGALDSYEELPGPIYLQGSEKGHVAYRSIVITPAEK